MTIPDCGTCDRRECPDHGKAQNMRSLVAEGCRRVCIFCGGDSGGSFMWNGNELVPRCSACFSQQTGGNVVARVIFRSDGRDLTGKTARERHLERAMEWLAERCRGEESRDWWILQALAETRDEPETCHVPAGDWVEKVVGQWPGDETDEEIEAGLDDMHSVGECPTCHGSGEVIVCVDDMCRADGHCHHGDGERPCPDCQERS